MNTRKLVYNFNDKNLKLTNHNIDEDNEMYVNILEQNEFYVMRINVICTSDYEFVLTSCDDYYKSLQEYSNQFQITKEEN